MPPESQNELPTLTVSHSEPDKPPNTKPKASDHPASSSFLGTSPRAASAQSNASSRATDILDGLLERDMKKVDLVDADTLLLDFLKRSAKDEQVDDQTHWKSVMNVIDDLAQNPTLQQALNSYRNCGSNEIASYGPLVVLCNRILDVLQEKMWKDELNTHLEENSARPIQFVRYENFSPRYDFPSDKLSRMSSQMSGKPDILIVLKDNLEDYARNQTTSKDAKDFDPSAAATKSTSKIMFKDILGCIEMKWQKHNKVSKGKSVGTPDNAPSHSSQANDLGPLEGSSDQPSGSRGEVSAEDIQPKRTSKRKNARENDTSSQKRARTENDRSKGEEKAGGANAHLRQLGHYAAEFLSRGPYVTHNIGIKVDYDTIQVCWFDRQNVISTREFNIFDNFSFFVAFITALSRFSLSDWGIDERFYPKEGTIEVKLQGDRGLCIDLKLKPLCHRVALQGRGTMVLNGKMTVGGITQPVAVKTSYPQVNRLSERVFVRKGDPCKYKPFLPIIYHDENIGSSTSEIRQRLSLPVNEETPRRRRIIISEPLRGIDTLNADNTLHVWYQCAHIHREMWQKGCQHGDISIYNLMYRGEPGEEESFKGVLIDWDLSIMRDDSGTPGTSGAFQFTGTIPFAALDLIDDDSQDRKYRHEMESFIWTLLYLCLNHEANRRYLALWHDSVTSAGIRKGFLSEMEKKNPHEGFEGLYEAACDLMQWFLRYIPSQARATTVPYELTTLRRDVLSGPRSVVRVPKKTQIWEEPNEEKIWEEFCGVCEAHLGK